MRAAVYERYGPPEMVRIERVPVPQPAADQVLVRVAATSVNLSDWECLVGRPLFARIGGLRRPARSVLGSDIAGTIVSVGTGVSGWSAGDEVYADILDLKGGFAEYAVVPARQLVRRPAALSAVDASAVPQAAAIAGQGTAAVGPGDRVLVNGAGGGSGTLAVQLAKLAGAHVTAVDNAGKLDYLRSLGADRVIDYRVDDPMRPERGYDHILDLVAYRSPFVFRRALAPGGRYRCVGGSVRTMLGAMTVGALAGRVSGRSIGVLMVREGPESFGPLGERCASGELRVNVDRTLGLDDTPEALRLVGEGRALGKVVVTPA
jgi:NADPH:quinone reductase-like Zn-dependent oxidoreductase